MSAGTTATGFAIPLNVCAIEGSTTTFSVGYQATVTDGVQQPAVFGSGFTYDTTQDPATNLATFKASVAAVAADCGFTVPVSNILVFTAVN